jgi:hypothetical protein
MYDACRDYKVSLFIASYLNLYPLGDFRRIFYPLKVEFPQASERLYSSNSYVISQKPRIYFKKQGKLNANNN